MGRRDGGSAFPKPDGVFAGDGGMSLRDYFAGQALAGWARDSRFSNADETARECYLMADAMLAARALPLEEEQWPTFPWAYQVWKDRKALGFRAVLYGEDEHGTVELDTSINKGEWRRETEHLNANPAELRALIASARMEREGCRSWYEVPDAAATVDADDIEAARVAIAKGVHLPEQEGER